MVDINNVFNKVKEAFDRKNYESAIALARNLLEIEPSHAQTRQLLRLSTMKNYETQGNMPSGFNALIYGFAPMVKMSVLEIINKKSEQMLNACEEYLDKNPKSIWGRHKLAKILQLMNYTDSAILEYEGIIQLDPKHIPSLKSLGGLYGIKQDLPKATEYYKKTLSLVPNDRNTAKALKDLAAMTTIEKGGWATAKSSGDILKDKSKSVELEKSSQYVKTSNIDEEITRLRKMITDNPDSPQNLVNMKKIGELYIQKKDFANAKSVFQETAKLAPHDETIAMRLGDIKIIELDGEINRRQKELTQQPENKELRGKIALLRKERVAFQIEEFTRRIKAHPTDIGLHFQLGISLYSAGRIDEAIGELQQSIHDPKRKIESYKYLGEAFCKKNLYDLATDQFKKALDSGQLSSEQSKELRYLLAQAYESNKNYGQALIEYKKILEVAFNYKDAALRVEKLKTYTDKN